MLPAAPGKPFPRSYSSTVPAPVTSAPSAIVALPPFTAANGAPSRMAAAEPSNAARKKTTPDEMMADPADRGRNNHIPHINRLCAWWSDMKDNRWHQRATSDQVETLLQDFKWVMKIQDELKLLVEFKRRRKP